MVSEIPAFSGFVRVPDDRSCHRDLPAFSLLPGVCPMNHTLGFLHNLQLAPHEAQTRFVYGGVKLTSHVWVIAAILCREQRFWVLFKNCNVKFIEGWLGDHFTPKILQSIQRQQHKCGKCQNANNK
jgi:hypothetical protein